MTQNKIRPATTDVDIDFQDRDKALEGLDYIVASRQQGENVLPHNSGVYFQKIPTDPMLGLSSVTYKDAEQRGYFKIDFLNASLYEGVRNEAHLNDLIASEPIWEMLEHEDIVKDLWQLGDQFELVESMKPKTLMELAMLLAVIRPAKRHLKDKIWADIELEVWLKPEDGDKGFAYRDSMFKKAHAISYALGIVVQMNLMVENVGE